MESPIFILLLGVLGVLVVILIVLGSISRVLQRLERRMAEQSPQAMQQAAPLASAAAAAHPSEKMMRKITREGDFMAFLAEDPSRKTLPKREQFAAYRKWRNEKGLNWPHGPETADS